MNNLLRKHNGRYEIIDPLGPGGKDEAYRARRTALGRDVRRSFSSRRE